jgi:hypothetical protein
MFPCTTAVVPVALPGKQRVEQALLEKERVEQAPTHAHALCLQTNLL